MSFHTSTICNGAVEAFHFAVAVSTIFQLYLGVSFIGGGGNRKKPPTCHKSLTNFVSHNVVSGTPRHEQDSNSQL